MMTRRVFTHLFEKYLAGEIRAAELHELREAVLSGHHDEALDEMVGRAFIDPALRVYGDFDPEQTYEQLAERLRGMTVIPSTVQRDTGRAFRMRRSIGWAAAVIMTMGGITYWAVSGRAGRKPAVRTASMPAVEVVTEVQAPTGNKAVLTLANGSTVVLDSVNTGSLAIQGRTQITKTGTGQLAYSATAGGPLMYNTLTVPRGSKVITLSLSDGSRVWLNASSTLRYPVAFGPKERKVEVEGEAYFEVADDKNRPFLVQKDELVVQVLGTAFNVNVYGQGEPLRVTLVKGLVAVNRGKQRKELRPGQQAIIAGGMAVQDDADMEQALAWKRGLFRFDKQDIHTIMRELSRWYDLDVQYQGEVDEKFVASIARDKPVSKVLELLSLTGLVRFKVEGKKITVIP